MNVNLILKKLLVFFDLDTISDLSEILKVSQPTISKWKNRNTIIPLKKKCKELGIYDDIFLADDKINEDSNEDSIDIILQKLYQYYNVFSMKELAEKIGISQQAISKWKKNNSIIAIKKKCRELKIYDDIFNEINLDFKKSNLILDDDILLILKSIVPIFENNEMKKKEFKEHMKKWLIENI